MQLLLHGAAWWKLLSGNMQHTSVSPAKRALFLAVFVYYLCEVAVTYHH
jgi:hypothetical protein